jgi:hypothetical protein
MMAITVSNSMSVNPRRVPILFEVIIMLMCLWNLME